MNWPFSKTNNLSNDIGVNLPRFTNTNNPIDFPNMITPVDEKIQLVHIFNDEHTYGGLTVMFRPSSAYESGVMVDCAIAVCSTEDKFDKKVGRSIARARLESGQYISLPLLQNCTYSDLPGHVKNVFSQMYWKTLLPQSLYTSL